MKLRSLDSFHQTALGHLVFGLVELAMAYGFADWAMDTGNWLWWVAAFVLLVGSAQNVVQAVVAKMRHKK